MKSIVFHTPYELMFGRSPCLPVDLAFGLPVRETPTSTYTEYVKNLRSRLEECYQLASRNALKSTEHNKIRFDRHLVSCILENGSSSVTSGFEGNINWRTDGNQVFMWSLSVLEIFLFIL